MYVNIRLVDGELIADLFITHQILDPSSSHHNPCKKGIPYGQTLRLNIIFSDNGAFDKGCNDLEQWPLEWRYNEKVTRNQTMTAWERSRKWFLVGKKTDASE